MNSYIERAEPRHKEVEVIHLGMKPQSEEVGPTKLGVRRECYGESSANTCCSSVCSQIPNHQGTGLQQQPQ